MSFNYDNQEGDGLQEGEKARTIALGNILGDHPISEQCFSDKLCFLWISVAVVDFLIVGVPAENCRGDRFRGENGGSARTFSSYARVAGRIRVAGLRQPIVSQEKRRLNR